jgi:hypothetical protein
MYRHSVSDAIYACSSIVASCFIMTPERACHLLYNSPILCNGNQETTMVTTRHARPVRDNPRRKAVLETAKGAGLLAGVSGRIAGRIRQQLVAAAKARSGIKSDTELLEYALARVALEDDFGQQLVAREGRVPQDVDLEF